MHLLTFASRLYYIYIYLFIKRFSPNRLPVNSRVISPHTLFTKVTYKSHLSIKLGLHNRVAHLITSVPCLSTRLSHHMSRVRSTLDSISKALNGIPVDLLSWIARFRPHTVLGAKGMESNHRAAPHHPGDGAAEIFAAPQSTQVDLPSQTNRKPAALVTSPPKEAVVGPPDEPHTPGYFGTNMDETYNCLSHHVSTTFGSPVAADDRKLEQHSLVKSISQKSNMCHAPALMPVSNKLTSEPLTAPPGSPASELQPTSTSLKKGLGHYLSYPGHSMQAFVGNYIAPLVPKFCSDSNTVSGEKDALPEVEGFAKQEEPTEPTEEKAANDNAKQLVLQREKIIARVSVDNRTRVLVQALKRALDVKVYVSRVEELSYHLLEFPDTRAVAVKEKVIPCLLRLRQAGDPMLQAAVRETLALVGYADPVKGKGIRVLSIDGGGTRGLVALQTLQKLEALTGKPIYQLFDYICGVSTGAILAFMLGVFQIPLEECENMYRHLCSNVFNQNIIVGTVKMSWSHAFYDSQFWESILKERVGSQLMIETSRNPKCPKVAAVSTIVSRGTPLKAYVFRNYNMPPGVRSHYLGGCEHQLWQAIRASSAAPGYFQEFVLGNDLHQDGGLLINNPTALAIHECKCLWPGTPVQCVVSLGTGRFEGPGNHGATHTSLKTKLSHIISSATDTEEVHTTLDALLPPNTYFRFNPFMTEDIPLDESRSEKLNLLRDECERYLERNAEKLQMAASMLSQEKSAIQRLTEWLKLKRDMCDGLPPFFSKL
uniref:Calcium-independent phospholipase A2-gamma-like n=1 Tax=Scleropages formosus TaxID=113540 RepID=A0A8C9TZL1_SCLFO